MSKPRRPSGPPKPPRTPDSDERADAGRKKAQATGKAPRRPAPPPRKPATTEAPTDDRAARDLAISRSAIAAAAAQAGRAVSEDSPPRRRPSRASLPTPPVPVPVPENGSTSASPSGHIPSASTSVSASASASASAPASAPPAEPDDLVVAEPIEDPLLDAAADSDAIDDEHLASITALDDIAPDAYPPDEAWGDDYLGQEATVPATDFGPGLDTRKELPYLRKSVTEEVRELERRIKARLTPAFPIEHRRRLPLEFLWRRWRDLAMRDRSDFVDEFGRDPMVLARAKPLLDFLYDTYFRVEVQGIEHIPDHGRALLVANHSGTLPYDGALLMHAIRREARGNRELRPLVEDFVFHFPYLGTFINRIGGVRACQENAERLLDQDQLVAVFPEGIKGIGKLFKERYRLQRFGRGGFIKLALRAQAPIIPVAIVGAEEIHPMMGKVTWLARSLGAPYLPITPTFPLLGPLGLLPLPAKWTIRFGPPIDLAAQHGAEAAGDRLLVHKLAEGVRSSIQEMLDDLLGHRKSVFF